MAPLHRRNRHGQRCCIPHHCLLPALLVPRRRCSTTLPPPPPRPTLPSLARGLQRCQSRSTTPHPEHRKFRTSSPCIVKFFNLPCQLFDAALHFATMTTFMAIERRCFIQRLVDVVDVNAMVLKHTMLILNLHRLQSTPSTTLTEQRRTHHQTLLISHSVAPSQPEFQVVNFSIDSDLPLSYLGKGSRGRRRRKW